MTSTSIKQHIKQQKAKSLRTTIVSAIAAIVAVTGVAWATANPEPSIGLYWYANVDPTIAPGVCAPQYQLLIRTDAPALYAKTGTTCTAWTKIGNGTSSGGTVTGTGTAPDLPAWTGTSSLGNYAGSSPSACTAGNVITGTALSAAGALTHTCTAIGAAGGVTGAGTSPDLAIWSAGSAIADYAGSSPSACTAGNVVTGTSLSAAGVLAHTCTAIGTAGGVTGTGTTNTISKFTGSTAVGNSSVTDNGTTFAINTNQFTVTEASGATAAGSLTVNATAATGAGDIEATTAKVATTLTAGAVVGTTQSSTATTTQNDFAINASATILRWSGASAVTFGGFTGGTDGRLLIVINASSTQTLALSNLAAGSTAANRLINIASKDLNLVGVNAAALYEYDGTASEWRMLSIFSTTIDYSITYVAGLTLSNSLAGTTGAFSSGIVAQSTGSHFRTTVSTAESNTCGTSPTVTATDAAGKITIGTSSSGNCTVTFKTTFTNPPMCIVRFEDAATNGTAAYSTSATALTITGAADSKTFDYICVGLI